MDVDALRAALVAVPDVEAVDPPAVQDAICAEVAYLASDEALASLARDTYWPKWRSPWWSMVLLDELGAAARIPRATVDAMVAGLAALRLHTFPIRDDEWPPGADRARDASCHCALGCMARVLAACGVDVALALPWVPPWFARCQLADGGYNCDEAAYRVVDECPSSMVGTVAPLEAMTAMGGAGLAPFAARAAAMLLGRGLTRGSTTRHNAEERDAASAWGTLCFPRFYFYDVLRGLAAVTAWAERGGGALPLDAIAPVATALATGAPDGWLRVERDATVGKLTWAPRDSAWAREPAARWPLLEQLSTVGGRSPALTRRWTATRRALIGLIDAGQVGAAPPP